MQSSRVAQPAMPVILRLLRSGWHLWLLATCLTWIAWQPSMAAQTLPAGIDAARATSSEWARFQEGLRNAKPAPMPKRSGAATLPTVSTNLLRFEASTGKVSSLARSGVERDSAAVGPGRTEGNKGVIPRANAAPPLLNQLEPGPQGASVASTRELSILPASTTPTPPSPLYYPYSFPFVSEFRLLLRFNVPGFGDRYYLCSASTASDFHLLSAGHCIYNHDPLDDGSGQGAGFAAEIWAWPAETDVVEPLDHSAWPDYPYGVTKMTTETTYDAWIQSSDLNWDFSFITLDRRIGDHVGWMGQEWGVTTASLNFDGYPAEAPYVPSDNPYQYPGFDSNNVIGYTSNRIQLDAFTYGGHSGGGVWRFDGTNDYIEGVNSTSNRAGYAEATRFTSQTHTDLTNTITNDKANRTPADLAQVIEYVFNGTSKGLLTTQVAVGGSFGLQLNAFNAGYGPAGQTRAYIYLTTDPDSVLAGTYIGTVSLGYLDTYQYTVQSQNVQVPANIQPGTYYVGWYIAADNPQYGSDNHTAIITTQTLQVVALSAIAVAPASVTGGKSASAAVYLSGAAPSSGVDVTLASSSPAAAPPASVHIPGGQSYVTFAVPTVPVSSPVTVTLQASGTGTVASTSFTVTAPSLKSLQLNPSSVNAGSISKGTVTLTGPAPAAGLTIKLKSSNSRVTVPASVTIAGGKSSATFTATTLSVLGITHATLTATYSSATKAATLTVNPLKPSALTLLPASVKGGTSSTATVQVNGPAPAGGVDIMLSSSSSLAKVPHSVHINAGAHSVSFAVTTSSVTSSTIVPLSAAYLGASASTKLTIHP